MSTTLAPTEMPGHRVNGPGHDQEGTFPMDENVPQRLDGTEGLTPKEIGEFASYQRQIQTAMDVAGAKAGDALREIRDRRLYRAGYNSFESYCLDRWGFSVRTGNRMIQVAAEKAALRELSAPEGKSAGQSGTRASHLSQREAAKRARQRREVAEPIETTATSAAEVPESGIGIPESAPPSTQNGAKMEKATKATTRPGPPTERPPSPDRPPKPPTARQSVVAFLDVLRTYDPAELGKEMTAAESRELREFAAAAAKAGTVTTPAQSAARTQATRAVGQFVPPTRTGGKPHAPTCGCGTCKAK